MLYKLDDGITEGADGDKVSYEYSYLRAAREVKESFVRQSRVVRG